MNKQKKRLKNGQFSFGTEWTDYTWNPIAGCLHGCRWHMPDGSEIICYAEDMALTITQRAYPDGFEHHYWHPKRLSEPLKLKTPAKIFCDSMSDLFGAWVPQEQQQSIFDVMRQANWHTFQSLTKAPALMLKYQTQHGKLPDNLWAGASIPPSVMMGKRLTIHQQEKMLHRTLAVLSELQNPIRWLCIEPLSFDVAPVLNQYPDAIQWAVIGAANHGRKTYQPNADWVMKGIEVLRLHNIPIFFKGNLNWLPWYAEFP